MRTFLSVLVALCLPGLAFSLDARATFECSGTDHHVTVSGYYIEEIGGEVYDGEISGIVFKCQAIGICEADFFYPAVPLPFEPEPVPGEFPRYTAEVTITPPVSGVAYRYIPYGVRPDGTLVNTLDHCGADARSYALASCDGVPFTRGTLTPAGSSGGEFLFEVLPCAEDCWTEVYHVQLPGSRIEELSGQPLGNLVGQVVDLFGHRLYCEMAGGEHHELTAITLAPDGSCGPVPTRTPSWDSLKAFYR